MKIGSRGQIDICKMGTMVADGGGKAIRQDEILTDGSAVRDCHDMINGRGACVRGGGVGGLVKVKIPIIRIAAVEGLDGGFVVGQLKNIGQSGIGQHTVRST